MNTTTEQFIEAIEPLNLPLRAALRLVREFESAMQLGATGLSLLPSPDVAVVEASRRPRAEAAPMTRVPRATSHSKQQCIVCDAMKGPTAFRRGSRMCLKCERAS